MILPRLLFLITFIVTTLGLYVPEGFPSEEELKASPQYISQFDIVNDVLDEALSNEQLDLLQDFKVQIHSKLYKRDLESSLESIIEMINSSGLIWDALDYAADHEGIIEYIGDTLGGLLKSNDSDSDSEPVNTSAILDLVVGTASSLNFTALSDIIVDSGLVQSVLDGLLLDDDFRPVLAGLIYNITENNMGLIALIVNNLLAPANEKSKRDTSGSLLEFIGNIVGGFLDSDIFYSGLSDVLNALNDTGFVVYTIQRFLATPAYINMTGQLISDTLDASGFSLLDINLSDLPINITQIVESALQDTSSITALLGGILLGDLSGLSSFIRRYIPGVKELILELQDMGLFKDLNDRLFPDSDSGLSKLVVNKNVTSVQTEENKAYASSSLNFFSVFIPLFTMFYFI